MRCTYIHSICLERKLPIFYMFTIARKTQMLRRRLCLKRLTMKQHIFFRQNKFARRTNLHLFFYKHRRLMKNRLRSITQFALLTCGPDMNRKHGPMCVISAKNNIYTLFSHIWRSPSKTSRTDFSIYYSPPIERSFASNARRCVQLS